MAKLTAQQANILASNFLGLAQSVGDFRYENWNKLSRADNQRLGSLQRSILNYGEDILAFSTVLVMNDVDASLKKIEAITVEIKSTIQSIQKVQKVIDVAAAIVTLAGAIIAKDPQSINTSIDGVIDVWKGTV